MEGFQEISKVALVEEFFFRLCPLIEPESAVAEGEWTEENLLLFTSTINFPVHFLGLVYFTSYEPLETFDIGVMVT